MMLEIMLCTFVFTTIVSLYIIVNLYRKCDKLELWTDATYQMIQGTLADFRKIDSTGHFESDDEIGAIFEQMKETINYLEQITEEN
tara:strand:+ start:152 stop:409 length:258 start_codon:yes stop_codon:yes gene_type:complete